jgi:putative inorganic carbon (HCO3(-)) transporter
MHLGLEGIVPMSLWLIELLCFLLSVFWRPEIGLYLVVPLLPLQTVRYRLHGYFLGEQFVDLLLLGVVLGLCRQGRPIVPRTPLNKLMFAYILFTYLSMFRGSMSLGIDLPLWFSDPRVSDWKNYVVVLPLIYFISASVLQTRSQMNAMLFALCVGLLLLAKNDHNALSGRDFSSFSYNIRDAGTMGGAGVNGLAAFEAQCSIFFIAVLLVQEGFLKRVGYVGVIAACIYCLVFALSRGAYAAFLAGIIYLGLSRSRMLLLALIPFLLTWQTIVPNVVRERILMTTDENGNVESSAAGRLSLWDEAMEVFHADPVFGVGFNTYAYGEHVGGYRDTHNVFVKVLVETGLVGLSLFVGTLYGLFRLGRRLYHVANDPFLMSIGLGFSALMLVAFIANLFGDRWMYFQITGYTYVFAGMVVRGLQITEEEAEDPSVSELDAPSITAAIGV